MTNRLATLFAALAALLLATHCGGDNGDEGFADVSNEGDTYVAETQVEVEAPAETEDTSTSPDAESSEATQACQIPDEFPDGSMITCGAETGVCMLIWDMESCTAVCGQPPDARKPQVLQGIDGETLVAYCYPVS